MSFLSRSGGPIDPPNVSIELSEVSIAAIGEPLVNECAIVDIVAPSGDDTSFSSCESRGEYNIHSCDEIVS